MADPTVGSYGELESGLKEGDGEISPMATSPRDALPIPKARATTASPRTSSRSRVRKERDEEKPKETGRNNSLPGFGGKGSTFENTQADNDLKGKIAQQDEALKKMKEQVEEKDALM